MKTIVERARDILNLSYLKKPVPDFMPKQKILVEFARDAALYIISSHQADPADPQNTSGVIHTIGDL